MIGRLTAPGPALIQTQPSDSSCGLRCGHPVHLLSFGVSRIPARGPASPAPAVPPHQPRAQCVTTPRAGLLLLLAQPGHLGVSDGDGETKSLQDVPSGRHYPGSAHHRGNGDHDPLDVVEGQPAFPDSGGGTGRSPSDVSQLRGCCVP